MVEPKNKNEKVKYLLIFLTVPVIFSIYLGTLLGLTWPISEFSINKSGVFGDSFGPLTALFSGLASAGMIITVLLQRKELQLQRGELQLTRIELKRTADASQKQVLYYEHQKKREDLYRLISKLSERINSNYNEDILDNGLSFHKLLMGDLSTDSNPYYKDFVKDSADNDTKTYHVVNYVISDLRRLKELIEQYEAASPDEEGECSTPFIEFYKGEYGLLVDMLHKSHLIAPEVYCFYR